MIDSSRVPAVPPLKSGVASPAGGLLRVVRGDPADDRLVQVARDPPHEVVSVFLGAGLLPEGVDLALQVFPALSREGWKLRRSADAARAVTRGAQVHRLLLTGLARRGRNLGCALRAGRQRLAEQQHADDQRRGAIHRWSPGSRRTFIRSEERRVGKEW